MAVVKLETGAEQDLDEAAAWYDGRWWGVGDGPFMAELRRCLALIAEAPERWPLYRVRRRLAYPLRRYVMQEYPYLLPYHVDGDTIIVVAVAHTSRSPAYWLPRLT